MKTLFLSALVVFTAHSAFAQSGQDCGYIRAMLARDYNNSLGAFDAVKANVRSLGEIDSEILKDAFEEVKGDILSRIQNYSNEVNSVYVSQQNDPGYQKKMLMKHQLYSEFGPFSDSFLQRWLGSSRLTENKKTGLVMAFLSISNPDGSLNAQKADGFLRKGEPIEMLDSSDSIEARDHSGRELKQYARLSISLTSNGLNVSVKSNEQVITGGNISQLQFVYSILKDKGCP